MSLQYKENVLRQYPPGTKPVHAGKKSWGINFCANTCGACIRTRANTGKYSWQIIYVLVLRQGLYFVEATKQSLCKTNSLACLLAVRDTPVAATLQRESFGGIIFVITTKKITQIIVSGNYFVIISARMVFGVVQTSQSCNADVYLEHSKTPKCRSMLLAMFSQLVLSNKQQKTT